MAAIRPSRSCLGGARREFCEDEGFVCWWIGRRIDGMDGHGLVLRLGGADGLEPVWGDMLQ